MNPYTVLRDFDHAPDEVFDRIDADPSDPRYDATLLGDRTHGVPVSEHIKVGEVKAHELHPRNRFVAGQTVHLSDAQAAEYIAQKLVAPAGAHVEFELVPHVYVEVK